jgi:type II secretory pathway pseudopilin PulG
MADRRMACRTPARRAFTLIELLIVMAIIMVLIGLLSTAAIRARQVGKVGATERLFGALLIGAQGFEQDHNRFPRSNGTDRISSASGQGGQMLAQSLLGHAPEGQDGKDGLGFRSQGRNTGKVYGPYVSVDRGAFGDTDSHDDVFIDSWDRAIAYWRHRGPRNSVWGHNGRFAPADNSQLVGDPNLDTHPDVDVNSLRTADIVLYSTGPDRGSGGSDDGANRRSDDVVFVGP